jgi:hypothetical protein
MVAISLSRPSRSLRCTREHANPSGRGAGDQPAFENRFTACTVASQANANGLLIGVEHIELQEHFLVCRGCVRPLLVAPEAHTWGLLV